jgi:hypothetical protein
MSRPLPISDLRIAKPRICMRLLLFFRSLIVDGILVSIVICFFYVLPCRSPLLFPLIAWSFYSPSELVFSFVVFYIVCLLRCVALVFFHRSFFTLFDTTLVGVCFSKCKKAHISRALLSVCFSLSLLLHGLLLVSSIR